MHVSGEAGRSLSLCLPPPPLHLLFPTGLHSLLTSSLVLLLLVGARGKKERDDEMVGGWVCQACLGCMYVLGGVRVGGE